MTIETAYRRIKAYFSKPDAKFGFDTEAGVCQYRAFDHDTGEYRKCAVGVLIPDKKYEEWMEDEVTPTQLVNQGIINGVMTEREKARLSEFLQSAQMAHDTHAIGKEYIPPKAGELAGQTIVKEQTISAFLRDLDHLAIEYGVKG